MEFSRQEYWNGLPFPSPGNLPNPGIKPTSLAFPALQVDSLPLRHLGRDTLLHFKELTALKHSYTCSVRFPKLSFSPTSLMVHLISHVNCFHPKVLVERMNF